jgi:hypothetical protein
MRPLSLAACALLFPLLVSARAAADDAASTGAGAGPTAAPPSAKASGAGAATPPRLNGRAMAIGGMILIGVGAGAIVIGGVVALNSQQAPAAGIGLMVGGASLIPAGVPLVAFAGHYPWVSGLPQRLSLRPLIARSGGGLVLQGAF